MRIFGRKKRAWAGGGGGLTTDAYNSELHTGYTKLGVSEIRDTFLGSL